MVHEGRIIARGFNGTNKSRNVLLPDILPKCALTLYEGTRHAELQAIARILQEHNPEIILETDLYVTVEPCIMCAAALRQYRVRKVFYGSTNDRFGGTGGVLSVHTE